MAARVPLPGHLANLAVGSTAELAGRAIALYTRSVWVLRLDVELTDGQRRHLLAHVLRALARKPQAAKEYLLGHERLVQAIDTEVGLTEARKREAAAAAARRRRHAPQARFA